MKPPRILAVEATPVNVPNARPEIWAFGKFEGMTSIILQVHTDQGIVGIGEAVSGGPSIRVMLTAIQELGELLRGREATAIEANIRWLTYAGGWSWSGRRTNVVLSGIEMALWDILGKSLGVPVFRLLGGPIREDLPFMYFLMRSATADGPELIDEAKAAIGNGFTTIYVKGRDPEADVELLTKLREELGPGARLRLDPNEIWMPSTAVRTLRRLEPLNMEFVEQPVRLSDIDQLARLRLATSVPIGANQSAWTSGEVFEIIRRGAADVIVTDAHQSGGISGFRRVIDLCETAGLPVVYHAFTTLTIGITASMHVMCSCPNSLFMAHQAYPPGFVGDDVVTEKLDISSGKARVPDKPGLGLELDPGKFKRAAAHYESNGPYPLFDPEGSPLWVPSA